jgi:integrase
VQIEKDFLKKWGKKNANLYNREVKKRLSYFIDGKRRQPEVYFKTKKEAEREMGAFYKFINDGVFESNNNNLITFKEAVEKFFEEIFINNMRESSKVKITNVFKKIYYPAFENVYLDTIDFSQIQTVLNESAKNGYNSKKGYSYSYIDSAIIYAKKFFNYAKAHSLIKDIPDLKELKNHGRKPDKNKVKHWTFKECQLFLKVAKENKMELKYYCACLVLINTGIRIGEYCALTWNDIDFENKYIKIHKSLTKDKNNILTKGEVKTPSSYREVPINDAVIKVLKEWRKENKYDILFPNMQNGKHVEASTLNKKLDSYLKEYSIVGLPRITPHGFRHSLGTFLINDKENPADVAKLLGHNNTNMTFKTYTHSTKEGVSKLANKMENLVN